MKLFEVLDKHVEWKWTKKGDVQEAHFELGEREVGVRFIMQYNHFEHEMVEAGVANPPEAVCDVEFMSWPVGEPERATPKITNTGHEFEMFATVATITQAYVRDQKPEAITFSASTSEPSRVKLYKRLVKRIEKAGYKNEYEAPEGGLIHWILVKR